MNLSNYVEVVVIDYLNGKKEIEYVVDLDKGKWQPTGVELNFEEVVKDLIDDGYKLKQVIMLADRMSPLMNYLFARD